MYFLNLLIIFYKDRLTATIEGRPLPTELPKQEGSGTSHLAQVCTDSTVLNEMYRILLVWAILLATVYPQ